MDPLSSSERDEVRATPPPPPVRKMMAVAVGRYHAGLCHGIKQPCPCGFLELDVV